MTATQAINPERRVVLFDRLRAFFTRSMVSCAVMCAILACIFTFDLFTHPDRSITFDGRVHITTISMYHDLLVKGEFPIVWVDAWGNYGYPLGLVSYQVTSYAGGLVQILVGSPVMAYNVLFWLATFFSSFFMLVWLRGHVRLPAALIGTILFIFAPYHIQNVYVRGALPEYVSSVFLLLALLGVQMVWQHRKLLGYLYVVLGVMFLALSHPMMLVTGSLLLGPYALFLWNTNGRNMRVLFWLALCGVSGLLLSSYYILPLLIEIKYFYYGVGDKLRASGFLSFEQLLSPFAPYFGTSHPGPPGVALRLGIFESGSLLLSAALVFGKIKKTPSVIAPVLYFTLFLIFLILPASQPLYAHFTFLNNLQYPWRMLSVVSIILPFLAALIVDAYGNMRLFALLVVAVLFVRIPQTYGKNYISTPIHEYQFTMTNLHTKNMAPVWAGESADYPPHLEKSAIIEGDGSLSRVRISNSVRSFHVSAKQDVRLADYTFFFPGWKVFIDGKEIAPEYQDPHYRGVMTYHVPSGEHDVVVRFIPTRIRKIGAVISLAVALTLISVGGYVFLKKQRVMRGIR